jgi:site-specific DNA-methyltransferase (adenine-specific)
MQLTKISIDQLKPAHYNPRKKLKPSDPEYEKLKRSILEFGYVDPIIVNRDFTVIGGHQRLTVLKDLGYTEIECIVVDIDKTKEKALNIALNKISGQWDMPMLKDLLQELDTGAIDMAITGFDVQELEDLMAGKNSPADIDDLLSDLDMKSAIDKPVWATIRTDVCNQELLEKTLLILENNGIKVERSYEH